MSRQLCATTELLPISTLGFAERTQPRVAAERSSERQALNAVRITRSDQAFRQQIGGYSTPALEYAG